MYNNVKECLKIDQVKLHIKQIVDECMICKEYKLQVNRNYKSISMKSSGIFQRISTDIFGPFLLEDYEASREEKKGYILSITDVYSRYTRLHFYYSVDATSIIRSLNSWIREFKVPEILISDNGTQYTSRILKEYLLQNNIKHLKIPFYTPSSNGISERLNQTISFIMSINKEQKIKKVVEKAEVTLNINYNRSLGTSPYNIVYKNKFYDTRNKYQQYTPKVYNNTYKGIYKPNQYVYKRILTAGKLDPKYGGKRQILEVGKNGSWVRLKGDKGWTHVKHLKL